MVSTWPSGPMIAAVLAAGALTIWPPGPRRTLILERWSRRLLRGGAVAGVAVATVAALPPMMWVVLLSAGLIAVTAAHLWGRARRRRRERRDLSAVIRALNSLIRELDSGAAPGDAARRIAEQQPEWLADLLIAAICRGRVGDCARAWSAVAERLTAAAVACARHGIALTVMLRPLAHDLEDRAAAQTQRDTQTAGPAMSGYVLAALPVGGILLGAGMGADPLDVLLGTGLGSVLLATGVALSCAGMIWADRIVAGRGHG